MRWNRRHHSCGIVKMASNDEKRLYVFGGYHSGHWRYWYDPSKIRNVLLQEMGHLHEPGHHEWVPPRVRHPLPDQRHEVRQDRPLPLHADWRQHSQLGGHKHCQLVPLERCKLQVFLKKQKKCHSSKLQGGEGGSRYAVLSSQCSSSGSARHQSQDQELCRALCPPSAIDIDKEQV